MPDVRETQRTEHPVAAPAHLDRQPGGYTEVYQLPAYHDGEPLWWFTSFNLHGRVQQPYPSRQQALDEAYAYASGVERQAGMP